MGMNSRAEPTMSAVMPSPQHLIKRFCHQVVMMGAILVRLKEPQHIWRTSPRQHVEPVCWSWVGEERCMLVEPTKRRNRMDPHRVRPRFYHAVESEVLLSLVPSHHLKGDGRAVKLANARQLCRITLHPSAFAVEYQARVGAVGVSHNQGEGARQVGKGRLQHLDLNGRPDMTASHSMLVLMLAEDKGCTARAQSSGGGWFGAPLGQRRYGSAQIKGRQCVMLGQMPGRRWRQRKTW
jgi:hypothetical protein